MKQKNFRDKFINAGQITFKFQGFKRCLSIEPFFLVLGNVLFLILDQKKKEIKIISIRIQDKESSLNSKLFSILKSNSIGPSKMSILLIDIFQHLGHRFFTINAYAKETVLACNVYLLKDQNCLGQFLVGYSLSKKEFYLVEISSGQSYSILFFYATTNLSFQN